MDTLPIFFIFERSTQITSLFKVDKTKVLLFLLYPIKFPRIPSFSVNVSNNDDEGLSIFERLTEQAIA